MPYADSHRQEQLGQARALRRHMTPEERTLWHRLRTNKLSGLHFRRQHAIEGYIVDFYCSAPRLVVEIDGPAHQMRKDYDLVRDETLHGHGVRVLRITNQEVRQDIEGVLEAISELAKHRIADARSDDT